MAHEEHETEDCANKTSDIGEELINFIERTSIGRFLARFSDCKLGISSINDLVGDDLKYFRNDLSFVFFRRFKRKQTLVSLNIEVLEISYGYSSFIPGEGDVVSVVDVVIEIFRTAGVDQSVGKNQSSVNSSRCIYISVNESIAKARSGNNIAAALTYFYHHSAKILQCVFSRQLERRVERRADSLGHTHPVKFL